MGQVDEALGTALPAHSQEEDLASLVEMGYKPDVAIQALQNTGNVQDAALLLSAESETANLRVAASMAKVYSTEPLDVPCMAVTSPVTGERVYVPLAEEDEQVQGNHLVPEPTDTNLLGVPIGDILRAVEQRRVDRTLEESSQHATPVDEAPLSKKEIRDRKEAEAGAHKLWACKYHPRNFMDLLSEGSVNREVLRWVKSWDDCVFGEAPSKKKKTNVPLGVRATEQPAEDNRPETKVILIAGPPGVGKTTLAMAVLVL